MDPRRLRRESADIAFACTHREFGRCVFVEGEMSREWAQTLTLAPNAEVVSAHRGECQVV